MGERHLQNLESLGVAAAIVEPNASRRETLVRQLGISTFSSLDEGLDWLPDFAVIASPTHLHLQHALKAVRQSRDVFIEKPLAHMRSGLSELAELVEGNNVVSLVGCNMRFHPGPAKIKELLERNCLGKLLFARVHVGSYLPGWRPTADYRRNYAAKPETGGGCILDCIHEIDLARWYLGEIEQVSCMAGHLSSLEIDTEDVAAMLFRHASGAISEVHFDYVQRSYERGCQIVGELGSLFWDFNKPEVRWFDSEAERWASFALPEWDVNQMYVDEMRHFLDCVQNRRRTMLEVGEAIEIMEVAFAAKDSARTEAVVSVGRAVPA
jgi:predicted dehydrogenase